MAGDAVPVLNGTAWWTLRQQFKRTLPRVVSDTYLATVLSLKEGPSKSVLRNLKLLGLIDEENQPSDLATRWRDDQQYVAVCEEISERAYPDELRAAVPGPEPDPIAASLWFQRSRRLGEGAAKNAARTYVLIASAKLLDAASTGATRTSGARTKNGDSERKATQPSETRSRRGATRTRDREQPVKAGGFELPRPQIAVQINIAPDMTAEQIDQVFASMARHFYNETGVD